jgi:hypothetical protein
MWVSPKPKNPPAAPGGQNRECKLEDKRLAVNAPRRRSQLAEALGKRPDIDPIMAFSG